MFIGNALSNPLTRVSFLQKAAHAIVAHRARRERHFRRLFDERGLDARMAVPLIDRRVRADAVEITPPVDVPEPDALGAFDDQIERRVVVRTVRLVEVDEALRDPRFAEHNTHHTLMHQLSDQTSALLERFRHRDHRGISEKGRTKLLLHGEIRPVATVLYHGIAASPEQFVRFAHELHARGHNVIVPRLPRHGHRNRLTDGARATASRRSCAHLRTRASNSRKAWASRLSSQDSRSAACSQRGSRSGYPVARAVAIAPFFGMSWMPNRLTEPFADLLLKLPNIFGWWDPIAREHQQPEHGYPRYASHAVGQALLLGREVFARAGDTVAARELILVIKRTGNRGK